jgi:alcohol dehydrogenase (cytochrome c)
MYMPMQNMCMTATTQTDQRDASLVYGFRTEAKMAPLAENVGSVFAVSAETGETRWERQQGAGVMSVVATAGGLVFGGDVAGIFRALDDATGEVLWEQDLGRMVSGYPVSFAVGGRQAIAVTTGSSLVGNAARRMSRDLPPEESDSRLVVFALP